MMRDSSSRASLAARLVAIGSAVVALVAVVLGFQRLTRPAIAAEEHRVAVPVLRDPPIPAESDVFREQPGDVAAPPWAVRRASAHPRTLATAQALRAYPGAPPRVPHGLTRDEFRDARCLTCHERGGYSQRFGAYAPITPHPQFEACLQCHAANDGVIGIALPGRTPDASCRQCHVPGAGPAALPPGNWRSAPWPVLAASRATPPPIPHDLQLRGNCLACHMGPGAIAEIRTTHAERANCRQCHVLAAGDAGAYVRPGDVRPAPPDGAP